MLMSSQPCTSAAPHRADWWQGIEPTGQFRLVRYSPTGQLVWQRCSPAGEWIDWCDYRAEVRPSTQVRVLTVPLHWDTFTVVD